MPPRRRSSPVPTPVADSTPPGPSPAVVRVDRAVAAPRRPGPVRLRSSRLRPATDLSALAPPQPCPPPPRSGLRLPPPAPLAAARPCRHCMPPARSVRLCPMLHAAARSSLGRRPNLSPSAAVPTRSGRRRHPMAPKKTHNPQV
nr:formin-like protein 3 [Aegilops tauschii subsp. strangulata]